MPDTALTPLPLSRLDVLIVADSDIYRALDDAGLDAQDYRNLFLEAFGAPGDEVKHLLVPRDQFVEAFWGSDDAELVGALEQLLPSGNVLVDLAG